MEPNNSNFKNHHVSVPLNRAHITEKQTKIFTNTRTHTHAIRSTIVIIPFELYASNSADSVRLDANQIQCNCRIVLRFFGVANCFCRRCKGGLCGDASKSLVRTNTIFEAMQ